MSTEPLYYKFAGSTRETNNGKTYQVIFQDKHQKKYTTLYSKSFSLSSFENDKTKTFDVAEEHRQVMSDIFGLSLWVFPSNHDIIFKQWFAGFIDGDGCITLTTSQNGKFCYPKIVFVQAQNEDIPKICQLCLDKYGGTITYIAPKSSKHKRQVQWQIQGSDAVPALYDLKEYCILKQDQVKMLIDSITYSNNLNCAHLFYKLQETHNTQAYRAQTNLFIDRLCPAYIAGLIDAEGNIRIMAQTSPSCRISQSSSPSLLKAIKAYFNHKGYIDFNETVIEFTGSTAVHVLKTIVPYLQGPKKQQAILTLQANEFKKTNRLHRDLQTLSSLKDEVQRLKHI